MTIEEKIRDEEVQCEQARYTYSLLRVAFVEQTTKIKEKIKDQGEKQIKVLENRVETFFSEADQKSIASFCSKDFVNEEATYELSKIVEMENKLNRDYLIYKTDNMKKDKTFKSFKSQAFKSLKE